MFGLINKALYINKLVHGSSGIWEGGGGEGGHPPQERGEGVTLHD